MADRILIFTDLDGTLLNHDDYSYAAAADALQTIRHHQIPLIFNSSKTQAEISHLRSELGNTHPFIVENGGAACLPEGYFRHLSHDDSVHYFSQDRPAILTVLQRLKTESQYRFRGFADYSATQLAQLTGLSEASAVQAQQRFCSEPIVWEGTEAALTQFTADLATQDLRLLRGGRFLHVMGYADKSSGMHWLLEQYQACQPGERLISIALGDSENDRAMLEAADYAVVIRAAGTRPSMTLERRHNVMYTEAAGPAGWQSSMAELLPQLLIQKPEGDSNG